MSPKYQKLKIYVIGKTSLWSTGLNVIIIYINQNTEYSKATFYLKSMKNVTHDYYSTYIKKLHKVQSSIKNLYSIAILHIVVFRSHDLHNDAPSIYSCVNVTLQQKLCAPKYYVAHKMHI